MQNLIIVGSIAVGAIFLIISLWSLISKNYIRIAPNMAAVLYGRKNKASGGETKGYRLITGGGVFKIPFFEQVQYMDLSNRVINIKVDNAPNKNGVMTTVEGVANTKFSSDKALLEVAVERFLGKDDKEVDQIIFQNLEGHLRSVVGKMSIEELIGDKQKLNQAVLEDASEDFKKLGISVDSLNIQNITDKDGYIINLGKKRTAEIKRDAEIGTAEAQRDSVIKTTTAEREATEKANENKILILQSNRNRDIKAAEMKASIDAQNEIANQAGPLSQAQALKAVVEQQAATAAAKEKATVDVEAQRALKEAQRYNAEKVVPAEAEKKSKIINAEAAQQAAVLEAEGKKLASIKIAEGEAQAIKVKKIAEAEGEAAKIERMGKAEGEAIYAKLSGEAKGILEKAEAYQKLDQTGKFLEILNSLQTLAPNVVREFAGVMAASTAHLGNVKDIKIIDFGGNGAAGSSTSKFGTIPVEVLTKMFEGLKGTGFDMTKLLNFIGVKPEEAQALVDVVNQAQKTASPKTDAPKTDKK